MRRALVAGVLLLVVSGCGDHGPADESLLGDGSSTRPAASASPAHPTHAPPTTAPALLTAAADAILDHDRAWFASLLGGDTSFRAQQLRTFDNLRQLPVAEVSFAERGGTVVRTVRLGVYDDGPLVGPSGWKIGGTADRPVFEPDAANPADAPWDLTTIRSRHTSDALVITDLDDASRAREVLAATVSALHADEGLLPVSWPGTAVVLIFRDSTVTDTYDQVPGGTLEHLGALTFPARSSGGRVVGMRVALLPSALDADGDELARILRHEIVHVALGPDGTDVPTWLSEGLAEYVANEPVPMSQRRIATVAVQQADAGSVTLPGASFNDAAQAVHYAVAWMACDYLASTRGSSTLWRLYDAMRAAHVGRDGTGEDPVLRRVVGMSSAQLADAAAARIRAEFG